MESVRWTKIDVCRDKWLKKVPNYQVQMLSNHPPTLMPIVLLIDHESRTWKSDMVRQFFFMEYVEVVTLVIKI